MPKPTTQQLAKELLEVRAKLKEMEDAYAESKLPYLEARDAISERLLEAMRKEGKLSERYENFTISRKKSTKAVVMNEFTAIEHLLKENPKYVVESISIEALREVEKGMLSVEGIQLETKEYISINQPKAA